MYKNIYAREYYLNRIRGFYHDDVIKVITGIRRCGKSSFLKSVANDLESKGVLEKDIIYIDLDKLGYRKVITTEQLETIIDELITDDDYKYLFIDEVQNIQDFESLVNAYREEGNISVFITGSNSYLLSGELTTKLTGRYIEIEMFTLNFREYLEMKKFFGKDSSANIAEEFENYIRYGGFPKSLEYDRAEDKELYIRGVVQQIIKKDIKKYRKIRNWSIFERVMTYVVNNFGATTNLTNILNYFHNEEHIPIKQETLNSYLQIMENAKILYKCPRFDLKSRKSLRGEQKYYLADLSIYFTENVDARINFGPVLENIMFTYLTSKGYTLRVGRIGNLECDFITRKDMEYFYIQVSLTIGDPRTEDREYAPFEKIRDNYPKYLFTQDPLTQKRNGVKHYNIARFISEDMDLQ